MNIRARDYSIGELTPLRMRFSTATRAMRRLRERLDRLEATMLPAQSDFEREFDLSRLSEDELRSYIMIGERYLESGEQAVTPEQWEQLEGMLNRARRNTATP